MYMPYTTHPVMPKVRSEAAFFAMEHGVRRAALRYGVSPGTISKWVDKVALYGAHPIPTISSRPHTHPNELPEEMVSRILALRSERNQCAEILHHRLKQEGIIVSLSSVKRILQRNGCTRFSPWKKWHTYPPRPIPETPGMLIEIDTIADGPHTDRLYAYTLLDVCSRWAYADVARSINTFASVRFLHEARRKAPFLMQTVQSDHGQEFSRRFTMRLLHHGVAHRHSRVRTPTDNGHLERFNRTLQQECFSKIPRSLRSWRKEIPEYLRYYNTERPHMGLEMQTPSDILKCFQAID